MEFVKDCLEMSLEEVATKYGMTVSQVLERYGIERNNFTDKEINEM